MSNAFSTSLQVWRQITVHGKGTMKFNSIQYILTSVSEGANIKEVGQK